MATKHPKQDSQKPKEVKAVKDPPKDPDEEEEEEPDDGEKVHGRSQDVEARQKPLRARPHRDMSDFERGFLKGLDAASKHVFAHERAKSTATPIAAEILDLQPPEEE